MCYRPSERASCRCLQILYQPPLLHLGLCLHLPCRSEFDLDYDSYHEDYYDRYTSGSSHTLLLVCMSQDAQEGGSSGFFILGVSNGLRCLSFSATQLSVILSLLTMLPVTTQQPCTHCMLHTEHANAHFLWRHPDGSITFEHPNLWYRLKSFALVASI